MTWLGLLKGLLTDPLAWVFALVVGAAAALGGYSYGHKTATAAFEQKQTAAENAGLKNEVKVVQQTAVNLNEVDKSYVKEKKLNSDAANAANSEFSGLRVKPVCNNTPAITPAASGNNGTGTAEVIRGGTGEVDFTGIERQVIELGHDYDDAITKIGKLQDTVKIYQNACGAVLP